MKSQVLKNKHSAVILCMLLSLLVGACGPATPVPTEVAQQPSPTPIPPTSAPSPSPTPVPPTSTPRPSPTPVPATATPLSTASTPSVADLEQAAATLRHLDLENLDEAQQSAVEAALASLDSSGSEGATLLKQEMEEIDRAGEKDPTFKLLAAWLLWDIGRLDEAETIAAIWKSVPQDEWRYRMLFRPAIDAASTQDARALPMLEALLPDREGSMFFETHFLDLYYPDTQEFLWGAYGPKALPVLHEVLKTSEDATAQETAIHILALNQYLPALPQIRQAIQSEDRNVRLAAILALGRFGHPDDLRVLIGGLDSQDAEEVQNSAYALGVYGDLSATTHIIPLLASDDADLRSLAAWGLGTSLATPEGVTALKGCSESAADEDLQSRCEGYVNDLLESAGLTWEEYAGLSAQEQDRAVTDFRNADITLKEGETALTREQLLEMVAQWKDEGRVYSDTWEWVENRHVLAVATVDDIDLLLEAKAMFYLRLSDECLYDLRIIDKLVMLIGRSRYR